MSRELLEEAHFVMDAAIKDWEVPDSPEAFIISMKGLMTMRDRIAAHLSKNKTKTQPPCPKTPHYQHQTICKH